jgi:hypothetical protein
VFYLLFGFAIHPNTKKQTTPSNQNYEGNMFVCLLFSQKNKSQTLDKTTKQLEKQTSTQNI